LVSRLYFDAISSREPLLTPASSAGQAFVRQRYEQSQKQNASARKNRADALGEVFDQLAAGLFKMPAWPDLAVE
jgi:hypothetical protein